MRTLLVHPSGRMYSETARRLGLRVAVNLIADPAWDTRQFQVIRDFAETVPEIVHLSVMTPYPGTEIWQRQLTPPAPPKSRTGLYIHARPRHSAHTAPRAG
jgi:hypothetical protein